MSDERFKDGKISPWDTAVVLAAVASIVAAFVGTSGLMAATHQIASNRSALQPCATCRLCVTAIASDQHSTLSR